MEVRRVVSVGGVDSQARAPVFIDSWDPLSILRNMEAVHHTCRRAGWREWLVCGMNGWLGRATPQKRGTFQPLAPFQYVERKSGSQHPIHKYLGITTHPPIRSTLGWIPRCTKARPCANLMPHLAWTAWQSHAACQWTKAEPFHTGRHATLNYCAYPLPLAHSFLLSIWGHTADTRANEKES